VLIELPPVALVLPPVAQSLCPGPQLPSSSEAELPQPTARSQMRTDLSSRIGMIKIAPSLAQLPGTTIDAADPA
jgi:hypothetical protein